MSANTVESMEATVHAYRELAQKYRAERDSALSEAKRLRGILQRMQRHCECCHGEGTYNKFVTSEMMETFDCEYCAEARSALGEERGQ